MPSAPGASPPNRVRLRQAVLVAAELEPVERALRESLALGEPFRDPGVAMFGLQNAVFALGDCFLEIVSPTQPGTAGGRYLERHGGDCGYMVMFDLEDLAGARARAEASAIRVVWEIDLPDISGTHLHPADIGGAIVSIDASRPYGSWRWGGPEWTGLPGRSPESCSPSQSRRASPRDGPTSWASRSTAMVKPSRSTAARSASCRLMASAATGSSRSRSAASPASAPRGPRSAV